MALEDLTQKIIEDAKAAAERIHTNAKTSVATLEREAAERERAYRTAFASETEELRKKQASLAHARAAQEARSLIEATQRELLDRMFTQALEDAVQTEGATYIEYLRAPLAHIKETTEELVVYAPAARLRETQEALHTAGITVPVEAREDIRGGFIAVAATSEYDARFEQTIDQVKRTHEPEVAHMLFAA